MASYHLSVHPNVSRGKGQSLVRTAAYNARARLTDERTGRVWDYRRHGALLFEGIYAAKAPDWARDLGQLVNQIERFEKRADGQLAMNIDIALPHEQTLEQNRRLIQDFVREQFMRKGYAAHVAIHAPDPQGDPRNIHAHVLVTLRQIGPEGFARTKAEQQERYRNRGAFVAQLREKWEALANRHLARNGIDARIDRRSLQDQGVKRETRPQHRGPAVTAMERRSQAVRTDPELCQHQAGRAGSDSALAQWHAPAEPLCVPERVNSVEASPSAQSEPETSPFGGENSCAIDAAPVVAPRAISDENPDQSPGVTGDVVTVAEPRAPPRTLGGAIKGLFRAAVKAVLRRVVETAPQPKRSRMSMAAATITTSSLKAASAKRLVVNYNF